MTDGRLHLGKRLLVVVIGFLLIVNDQSSGGIPASVVIGFLLLVNDQSSGGVPASVVNSHVYRRQGRLRYILFLFGR
ncbi:MAG: hypothetical protein FWF84_01345, partial [Kiritimatiellaeota bacterium]|nr:hypothetical protein [Kiritimatiellota bacterium]